MRTILAMQATVLLLVLSGWVQDIYKFTRCDFKAPYRAEAIYGVGLIPPIGMVVGWFNIGDK